jgi:hypothetical protein
LILRLALTVETGSDDGKQSDRNSTSEDRRMANFSFELAINQKMGPREARTFLSTCATPRLSHGCSTADKNLQTSMDFSLSLRQIQSEPGEFILHEGRTSDLPSSRGVLGDS